MKGLSSTLPWLAVFAVLGGVVWWLLAREMTAGKWVLGGVLVAHGLVHVLFTIPVPARTGGEPAWPFALLETWPITALGLDGNVVRIIGVVLIACLVLGLVLAGLSTVGLVVPAAWWAGLVGVGDGVSAVTLVFFFNPQLFIGLVIDAILLWVAVAGVWRP